MMGTQEIVQKLWALCHVLRDDGTSYQDLVQRLQVFFAAQGHAVVMLDVATPSMAPTAPSTSRSVSGSSSTWSKCRAPDSDGACNAAVSIASLDTFVCAGRSM